MQLMTMYSFMYFSFPHIILPWKARCLILHSDYNGKKTKLYQTIRARVIKTKKLKYYHMTTQLHSLFYLYSLIAPISISGPLGIASIASTNREGKVWIVSWARRDLSS